MYQQIKYLSMISFTTRKISKKKKKEKRSYQLYEMIPAIMVLTYHPNTSDVNASCSDAKIKDISSRTVLQIT